MNTRRLQGLLVVALGLSRFGALGVLPDAALNLKLAAPIKTWDEAIPLGNGTMGVLLWGESNVLRLSLDRGDLWDERPSPKHVAVRDRFNWTTMQQLVASNRMAEFHEVFDSNYDYNGPPTKLPAGRLEITLDSAQTVEAFELKLATAEGAARLAGGGELRAFVNADQITQPVAVVRIPGPPLRQVRLRTPDSLKKLGYEPARITERPSLHYFTQVTKDNFTYVVCVGWRRQGGTNLLAVTVSTSREDRDPEQLARRRV